jgi:formylglycine-generating enzyme required for sulfatase activity
MRAVFPGYRADSRYRRGASAGFYRWQVNGHSMPPALPLKIQGRTRIRIEAVFNNKVMSSADQPAMVSPLEIPATRRRTCGAPFPVASRGWDAFRWTTRCDEVEKPRVRQTFSRSFEMLDREVSVDDFQAFASASSRQMPRQARMVRGSHPSRGQRHLGTRLRPTASG